jgi:putative selenium metabolism protein SsnA
VIALRDTTFVELDPARVSQATLLVDEDGAVSTDEPPAGALVLDCRGLVAMPGFVCAHTHLYSALARGMPPPQVAPENFQQILERVWWKLDRALDAEAVEVSALIGALEALKSGTTTLVDHHASPSVVDGSLDLVGGAIERAGLRGVLCYEVTERNGMEEARAGIRENDRFLARARRPLLRGLVGAHAAFTISSATAESLAEVAERHGSGVHIHVAEDAIDARKDGVSTVKWLAERGLLTRKTLYAHCVHASDEDVAAIRAAGAHVAHNPRSNQNNAVGYAQPARFGDRLLLGTDGIGADMRAEAFAAFVAARDHHHAFDPLGALVRNQRFAAGAFGTLADLVVLDYRPPTPIEPGNLFGHLLFGVTGAPVRHAIVNGRLVLRDGRSTVLDEDQLYGRAREVAKRVWSKL